MREAAVVARGRQYPRHPVLDQVEFGAGESDGEGRGLLAHGGLGGHLPAEDTEQLRLALPAEGFRAVDGTGEEGLGEQPPVEGAFGGRGEGRTQLEFVAYRPDVAGGGARGVLQDGGQTDHTEDLGSGGGIGEGAAPAEAALVEEVAHPALVPQLADRARVGSGEAEFGGEVGARDAPGVGRVDEPAQVGQGGQGGGARGLVGGVEVDDVECRGVESVEFVAVDVTVAGEQTQPVSGVVGRLDQASQAEGECLQGGDGHDAWSSLVGEAVPCTGMAGWRTSYRRRFHSMADHGRARSVRLVIWCGLSARGSRASWWRAKTRSV